MEALQAARALVWAGYGVYGGAPLEEVQGAALAAGVSPYSGGLWPIPAIGGDPILFIR